MNDIKILFIDIETSPIESYTWGPKYESNIIEVIEPSRILSYSVKYLNGKQITKGWPDYKGYKKGELDDKSIVNDLWELINGADILVGQNIKDFDIRTINARFIAHGLTPTSPYKVVDTKQEARKHLRLASNSLDDICDYFKIGRKQEHEGFSLWKKCLLGDKNAWQKMLSYNKKDVLLTEQLYLKLLPWINNHPNLGMYASGEQVCMNCGSDKLQARGFAINKTTKYRRFQCTSCGSWGRDSKNVQINKPLVGI